MTIIFVSKKFGKQTNILLISQITQHFQKCLTDYDTMGTRILQKNVRRYSGLPCNLTLWTPGAGVPVFRNLQNGAKHRYTGSAQISLRRQTPVYRVCVNL